MLTFRSSLSIRYEVPLSSWRHDGLMVSALVSGLSGRIRVLAEDIVLCSRARHFTLTVPLSTQVCKWVPGKFHAEG